MKIRYLLKPTTSNQHVVYLALYNTESTELISTGQRCIKEDVWNDELGEPKKHDTDLYRNIEEVKAAVQQVSRDMHHDKKVITPYSLKQAYQESLKTQVKIQVREDKKHKAAHETVADLVEKYLTKELDDYADRTRDNIKVSLRTVFKAYLLKHAPDLEKKDLTLEFIKDYARQLTADGYADSTHGKTMMHLKWFLKYIKWNADDREEIEVKIPKPGENNIIYLKKDELAALEAVDASKGSIEKQKAKDLFLLGCYFGLRISDIRRIRAHHLEDGILKMTLKKVPNPVLIPILPKAAAILERYGNRAPSLAEQKVNDWIKPICADAGITKPTVFLTKYKGIRQENVHPKNELITTHVACKTFITLAQDWGMSPLQIATIVGKNIRTVMRYYLDPNVKQAQEQMIQGATRAQMQVVPQERQISA